MTKETKIICIFCIIIAFSILVLGIGLGISGDLTTINGAQSFKS